MRRRYFSPELKDTMESYHQKQTARLRWMGSQVRLASPPSFQLDDDYSIGPYTYYRKKQIGSGYSSKVYKARKANDNNDYAIKVIELKKYSSSNMELLASQIQILKSLNHPNVLKCYDVYKTERQCFIVTQYCPNGDLLNHLTKKGKCSQKQAISIIKDITEGYKYLCQNHVIHRDIKPANILRSDNKWKIADFGFAINSHSQIKTKYNVGTPLYMPPEALIENIYSAKSDIFSIGIILYELLTGCTPWESRTQKDLIRKMGAIPFKVPDKYNISKDIKQTLQIMCQVKVKRRMQVEEFMNFDFNKLSEYSQNPQQKLSKVQKGLQNNMSSRISQNNLDAIPQLMRLISSKSIMDAKDDVQQRKRENTNNEIMISQLHYCRFLYYMVRNNSCMLIDKKQTQKICLVIFTHLLKLVKLIAQPNSNWLNLKDWDKFKRSKKYLNTYLTVKQYAIRYEKQYLAYLKIVDICVLQQLNELFMDISQINVLNIDFYQKVMRLVQPTIRVFNHNLSKKLLGNDADLEKQEIGQIQALKSIFKYYRLLQMSISHFQDFQYFEANCSIKVNVDYKKSGVTKQYFCSLRHELKKF